MNNPMVSYAMNFEDVILCRALRHVAKGCYVDVGASTPLVCSNTAALYQMGWRGICIEPIPDYKQWWMQDRPEDTLINALVGAQSGEADFYFYRAAPQLSTCSAETVERWKNNNCMYDQKYILPVITLNEALEKYLNDRTIHLLTIDVEGFENQVVKGFDIKKYKPWIIVIEATIPGMSITAHKDWENDILDAGYSMAYSDGINRFYLADNKSELLDLFKSPPNARDNFITYKHKILMDDYESLKTDYIELEKKYRRTLSGRLKTLFNPMSQ